MGKIVPAGPERSPLPPLPSRLMRIERRARKIRARRARARSARLGIGLATHEERAILSLLHWGRAIGWASFSITISILLFWGVGTLLG